MRVVLLVLAGVVALVAAAFLFFVVQEVRRSGWRVFRTRMGRSSRIWRLAARRALRFFRLKRLSRAPVTDDALDAFHLETAEQVFELMGGMKGAVMKLGQMASILGDSLPDQYAETLRGLQQSAPPMSYDLMAGVVAEDLGETPDHLFAEFSTEPVAAASIGQVHRARLHDGTEVAVKVQYPGVDTAIRADLDNMFLLTTVARAMAPGIDPEGLVSEIKSVMLDELDYTKEAANQAEFARAYDGHPWIRIPKVFPERSGRRVLTTQWVSGRSFYDVMESPQVERDLAAEQLFRFFVGSVGRLGFFNADPHPGNYFFGEPDGPEAGTIWFLDFGMVKRFTPEIIEQLGQQVVALRAGDREVVHAAMIEYGWFAPDLEIDMERVYEVAAKFQRSVMGPDPFTYTREHSKEVVESTMSIQGPYGDIVKHITLPPDHVMLNRIQLGITALLGRLEASGPWAAIFDEYLLGGPPATPLGEAAAGWPRVPVTDPAS